MNREATFKTILKHGQLKNHRRKPQDTETLVEKYFTEKFYGRLALRKSRCEKTRDFLSILFKLAQYFFIYKYIYILRLVNIYRQRVGEMTSRDCHLWN